MEYNARCGYLQNTKKENCKFKQQMNNKIV